MPYTKRDIVEKAFTEIGLAQYIFDLQPQQLNGALSTLDMMMAMWESKGIRLGYPLPSSPNYSDLDDNLGAPDRAYEAMYFNLASRIASGFGKTISQETRSTATSTYKTLLAHSALPIEMQLGNQTIPSGAGNKGWRYYNNPFLRKPQDPITLGSDDILNMD